MCSQAGDIPKLDFRPEADRHYAQGFEAFPSIIYYIITLTSHILFSAVYKLKARDLFTVPHCHHYSDSNLCSRSCSPCTLLDFDHLASASPGDDGPTAGVMFDDTG